MNRKARNKRTVECDKSFEGVSVVQILEGVYNEKAARELGVKELVQKGKIKEAIDVLQEKHPAEAISLMSRYKRGEKDCRIGVISRADWSVEQQRIGKAALEFSEGV